MAQKKISKRRIEPDFSSRTVRAHGSTGGKPAGKKQNPASRRKPQHKHSTKHSTQRSTLLSLARKSLYWSFLLSLWGVIAIGIIFAWYGAQLPSSSKWGVPDRPPNAKIISANGALITNRGLNRGETMGIDEMSPYIPMAVVAIEDRRFKSHFGVDLIGFSRAMFTNLMSRRLVQGGSTLTQQLAKNLFLEPERTLERKVQEVILALWLEQKFSKDEILELYLNRVYFGSGAYGVDAAARRYFGKSARDVNLAEAAILAGLLKAPSKLSPARNPKLAHQRSQLVLAAMKRENFITDREAATALSMPAAKAKRFWSGAEHYVADLVMKQLPGIIGELREDVIIDTTLDLELTKLAEAELRREIKDNAQKHHVEQGALITMTGSGAIRALVGGVDYAKSQFNRAIDGKRQPGSAFKPMVYLAALEHGRAPDTLRIDQPMRFGKWQPENYDRKYRGAVTLTQALTQSLNTIAAQLISEIGPGAVGRTAKRLGITSKLNHNASLALGTSEVSLAELTAAYIPFANGGYRARPFVIKRVRSTDGKVLYERNPAEMPLVVGSRELGMMNAMLRENIEQGTGRVARIKGWDVAGKTGTSQGFRDALFIGYSANLVTGVWLGNDDNSPMKKVTGGSLPAKIFGNVMRAAHEGEAFADLPGNYLLLSAEIVPTPSPRRIIRPAMPIGDRLVSDIPTGVHNRAAVPIRTSHQAEQKTGPANILDPQSSVPNATPTQSRPNSILELIFGG